MLTVIPADRLDRIAALGYDYASQPREAITACNLCGGTVFVVLTHRDRYGYPAQAHACRGCGLVFLNPRMTAAAYGRFYDGVYRPLVSAFHGRLIDATTIQTEQRGYAGERAELLRPFVAELMEDRKPETGHRTPGTGPRSPSLLDIGGSTGVIAHHFAREFGFEATVIDPAPLEVEQARRLGVETITGLVEQHDFGARRFDLVMLCQTVDHLLDVAGTLARIRQLLADRGLLFLDIVDFRAAYLRSWSVEDATKIDHPYYLTQETMDAYLRRTGFATLRADYAADHLHVSYVCRPAPIEFDAVPSAAHVDALFREIRFVQNGPRPA